MSAVIEVEGLTKTFRSRRRTVEAVRGLDLCVPEGVVFGFLGPNGAGKTTVVRILTTLSRASGGSARVAGYDVVREPREVRRAIGYVSQTGGVDMEMSGRRNLTLQARLQGADAVGAAARVDELAALFQLADFLDRPAMALSGGQRRRLALAMGLVHRPRVLFLDEPTVGLDPHSRAELWEEVRKLRAGGATVFLTTHYLEEAEALCDEVAIIDQGTVINQGAPTRLKRDLAVEEAVNLELDDAEEQMEEIERCLRGVPGTRAVTPDHGRLRVTVDDGREALPALVRSLDDHGVAVRSASVGVPTLNDLFLQQTGVPITGAPGPAGAPR
jgi:ABC-2 type transport system ATP-binding protein